MNTEPQRTCPSCANEFSGAMEFCQIITSLQSAMKENHFDNPLAYWSKARTLPSDTLAKLEALGTKLEQKPKEEI
jgi:hypothetical protein